VGPKHISTISMTATSKNFYFANERLSLDLTT